MNVQVLGPGCQKCQMLLKNVKDAVAQTAVHAEVTKVEDMFEIASLGVNRTPAVIINGQIKVQGRLATVEEISGWLQGL